MASIYMGVTIVNRLINDVLLDLFITARTMNGSAVGSVFQYIFPQNNPKRKDEFIRSSNLVHKMSLGILVWLWIKSERSNTKVAGLEMVRRLLCCLIDASAHCRDKTRNKSIVPRRTMHRQDVTSLYQEGC